MSKYTKYRKELRKLNYERGRKKNKKGGYPWAPWEDKLALLHITADRLLGAFLERTVQAIQVRRSALRRRNKAKDDYLAPEVPDIIKDNSKCTCCEEKVPEDKLKEARAATKEDSGLGRVHVRGGYLPSGFEWAVDIQEAAVIISYAHEHGWVEYIREFEEYKQHKRMVTLWYALHCCPTVLHKNRDSLRQLGFVTLERE